MGINLSQTLPSEHATYLWVAETVLKNRVQPLTARQIVNFGFEDGYFADKELSRTPEKSMQARLSTDILGRGERSRFVRTERGKFFLRELLQRSVSLGHDGKTLGEYTAIRRAPLPPSEHVLVCPRDAYAGILDFQGINTDYSGILKRLISTKRLTYIPRTEAELDNSYKQFVTYTIIQRRDKILSFRRGRYNRVAAFLRGARCLGFGGHITEDDLTLLTHSDRGIKANAIREISEEIRFGTGRPPFITPDDIEVLGFLNDDSTDVGTRHVAALLRYWVPETQEWTNPSRGEASITQLKWMKTAESEIDLMDFEYWSQLLLRTFFPTSITSRPSVRLVRTSAFETPHLLCVIGSVGSGKSITTDRLCRRAGYIHINSGRVIARLLGIPPVPETPRAEFQTRAHAMITAPSGPKRLVEALLAEVANNGAHDRIIIDGIRNIRTLAELKSLSPRRVATLFIHTPPDVAYQLYRLRDANVPDLSLSDFMEIYNSPVESELNYLIGDSDAVLYNWIGLNDYEAVVEKFIEQTGLNTATFG